jgi:hypothetical protein
VDAIDVAAPLAEVPADIDGQGRPLGPAPDAGADEYAPAPALTPRLYLPVILRGYDRAVPVPTPTTQPPVGGGLISPADLVYRGAFRLPPHPTGEGWEWSSWASAATYVPTGDPEGPADGYPGSLYAVGNDLTREVGEVAIPVPVISAGKELSELNVATQLQDFGSITGALFPEMELPRVGLAYLPPQGEQSSAKLYFAMAPHMGEGDAGPSHGWSELDLSRPQTAGLWRVGDYWNYVTGDYLFEIPSNWATAYLSGRSLATGRFRDGGQGAMGPSLFAVAPWAAGTPPPAGARLPATPLLLYEDVTRPAPAALNGYHHSDEWTGAAWLTAGEDAAVLFAGTKGQGDSWYGCPDGTDAPPWPPDCWDRGWWSTSFVGQFLFYDPADFAAVTRGELGPEQPQPYATLNVDEVLYHIVEPRQKTHVGALAFHRTRGLLYLFEPLVDEDRPLVHVWKVE